MTHHLTATAQSRFRSTRRVPAILFGLLCLLALPAAAKAQARLAATLLAVHGLTQVRRSGAGAFIPGYRRMPLGPGDLLRTGVRSKAQLLFVDGSALTLNQNSALVIPQLSARAFPERLRLQEGELWARVVHGRRVRFETPTAVAGVRGTELNLRVDADGAATLTVVEGEVSFSNERGSVVVRTSQQSIARPGQPPTVPVTVNVPFIIEWTNDVLPAVLLLETRFVGAGDAALRAAEAAAARLPEGPARWLAEGDVRHDRGDVVGALALYDRAATALEGAAGAGERARVAARRGQALLELGRVEQAVSSFRESIAADPAAVEPRLGLVMALLSRRQLDAALAEAHAAVAAGPEQARAHLARALVRIRQGERGAAAADLERALRLAPEMGQAHAWKVYLLRADGRLAEAEEQARKAVQLDPASAVAQQSLADALFLQGRARSARTAARRAVRLNPLSAAAQVALGQSELALGETEAAVRAAHRAAALDPDLERARYFLGVALAQQRNLVGAERQLRQALALEPDLTEARTLLARVLNEQGRRGEALTVAREAVERAPASAGTRSALGSILWRQGRLAEAVESYREALRLEPGSALARIELARVYLDQNRLPEALEQALAAVDQAISSSEAHAILGLVYERGGNNEQALRQYREAVSLSPENALARIGLALQSPNSADGISEFAQALLRDPSVTQQQFKPGVTSELNATGGSDDLFGPGFRHRDQYARGRLYDLSFGSITRDGGWRGHDDARTHLLNVYLAGRPSTDWNTLYRLIHFAQRYDLPGLDFQPDLDSRFRSSLLENSLSGRWQVAPGTFLWAQGGYQSLRQGDVNPDAPDDGRLRLKGDVRNQTVRFDLRLDRRLGRFDTLTAGYFWGKDRTHFVLREWHEPTQSVEVDTFRLRLRDRVFYTQLDHRTGRLSLIGGVQYARVSDSILLHQQRPDLDRVTELPAERSSRWMPYAAATLQVAPRTFFRLIGHGRTSRLSSASLLPTEAFITGELVGAAFGGRVRTLELDLEHRFSPTLFGKLFLFRSDVRTLRVEEPEYVAATSVGFTVPRARVEGVGFRLERQLTPLLAGYLRATLGRATDRGQGITQGWQLPQRPRSSVLVGLNFVDRAGTKLLLEGEYLSSVYAESTWSDSEGFDPLVPRPRENPRLLLNLRFGRERSVRQEWIVRINNLLNHDYAAWPGLPGRGRSVSLELRQRF